MTDVFKEEWKLYRRGLARPPLEGETPRGEARFDLPARAGDIRVFADTNTPFIALLAADRGLSGWMAIPVSPFHAPASEREIESGGRIFQLWNACTASRRFAERSWLVDRLDDAALEEVKRRVAGANPGRITAGDGIVARYEREFLVSGGSFIPLARKKPAKPEPFFAGVSKWGVAASLALVLGTGALMYVWRDGQSGGGRKEHGLFTVREYETIELVEATDAAIERLPEEDPSVDFPIMLSTPEIPVPFMPCAGLAGGRMPRLAPVSSVRLPFSFGVSHFGEKYSPIDAEEPLATVESARRRSAGAFVRPAGPPVFLPAATNMPHRTPRLELPHSADDVKVDVNF